MSKKLTKGQVIEGTLGQATYLGTDTQFEIFLTKKLTLSIRLQNSALTSENYKYGDQVFISIDDGDARFLID